MPDMQRREREVEDEMDNELPHGLDAGGGPMEDSDLGTRHMVPENYEFVKRKDVWNMFQRLYIGHDLLQPDGNSRRVRPLKMLYAQFRGHRRYEHVS
eukprot:764896-Hanusia_phi.AAC.1